jgi:hypothetical protein
VRGNIAVTALLSGDAQAINNVGTLTRAMERSDIPAKVVCQSLKKNLFWLVTKPEIKTLAEMKGKVFGTTTFGGSQHLAASRFLHKAGLDPEKDVTVVIGGDVPAQLQSLLSGVIQLAALSPPTVILARDKFKLKIHGSTLDDLAIQRISLDSMFHQLILINRDRYGAAKFAINSSSTLTVTNNGMQGRGIVAEGLTVSLTIPADTTVVAATGTGYQGTQTDDRTKATVATWKLPRSGPKDQEKLSITLSKPVTAAANLRGDLRWTKPSPKTGPSADVVVIAPAPL